MRNSENDDVLAQLQGAAGASAPVQSNEELLKWMQAEPEPNPMDQVPDETGDIEQDSKNELTALEQGFKDRAKREADRFRLATDSEYWVAVCFKTREDKEAFLQASGLDKVSDKYIDGYAAARVLGLNVEFGKEA